jgi:hypothetical protein
MRTAIELPLVRAAVAAVNEAFISSTPPTDRSFVGCKAIAPSIEPATASSSLIFRFFRHVDNNMCCWFMRTSGRLARRFIRSGRRSDGTAVPAQVRLLFLPLHSHCLRRLLQ